MAIIDSSVPGDRRHLFRFSHGIRLELFYALQALTDDDARIHSRWRSDSAGRLPVAFHRSFAAIGATPLIWPLVADAAGPVEPDATIDELLAVYDTIDLDAFRRGILIGVLHDADLVDRLISGELDLAAVVDAAPAQKQQTWLRQVGLHPYDPANPLAVALQRVMRDPAGFHTDALLCVRLFWQHVFAETWRDIEPALRRSVSEKRRMFESSSVNEFLSEAVMRLEIDEQRGVLKSMRGGCEIALETLQVVHVLPSAFNAMRMWTTYLDDGQDITFVPYFDASISVEPIGQDTTSDPATQGGTALEPALIFKALGDGTRYSMVQLIGQQPRTSADLARDLGVSKATISHHLGLLREAGLIGETYESGGVRLSLKTDVIQQLSTLATRAFVPG